MSDFLAYRKRQNIQQLVILALFYRVKMYFLSWSSSTNFLSTDIIDAFSKRAYPFKRQSHKIVKHAQTIRWQLADELFECV